MSSSVTLAMPRLLAGRPGARALIEDRLPNDASDIVLDFSGVLSAAPSALDEIVKALMRERRVNSVHVISASARSMELIQRFAMHYRASDRLTFSGTRLGQTAP